VKTSELKYRYPTLGMWFHLMMNKIGAWFKYKLDPQGREWYESVMSGLSYREDR